MYGNKFSNKRDVLSNLIKSLRDQQPLNNKTLIRARFKDLPDGSLQLMLKMPGLLRSAIVTHYEQPKVVGSKIIKLNISLIELGEINVSNLTVAYNTLKSFDCTCDNYDYIGHTDAIYSHISNGPRANKNKTLIPITTELNPPKDKVYAGKVISVTAGLKFNGKPVTEEDEIVVEHEKGTLIIKKNNLLGYEKADSNYFIFISKNGTATVMTYPKALHYFEMKTYFDNIKVAKYKNNEFYDTGLIWCCRI